MALLIGGGGFAGAGTFEQTAVFTPVTVEAVDPSSQDQVTLAQQATAYYASLFDPVKAAEYQERLADTRRSRSRFRTIVTVAWGVAAAVVTAFAAVPLVGGLFATTATAVQRVFASQASPEQIGTPGAQNAGFVEIPPTGPQTFFSSLLGGPGGDAFFGGEGEPPLFQGFLGFLATPFGLAVVAATGFLIVLAVRRLRG